MNKFTEIAKKTPILPSILKAIRNKYLYNQLKKQNTEQVFTNIFRENTWGGKESVSGVGSDLFQTRIILKEIPTLLREFAIHSMLDIPCGDFHWLKELNLNEIIYSGAEIVAETVKLNNEKYSRTGLTFQKLDLITDILPKVDLIFCRDCLVHFSNFDILKSLNNICNSESKYLLTTTFVGRKTNKDIATGQWRPLNLGIAPIFLPKPLKIINEGCTESNNAFADKSLGLWLISDIQKSISNFRQ